MGRRAGRDRLAVLLIISVVNTDWPLAVADRLWSARTQVALLLFKDSLYVFALQVVAVLLTAAVVGGVFLAKREDSADPGEREPASFSSVSPPVDAAKAETP